MWFTEDIWIKFALTTRFWNIQSSSLTKIDDDSPQEWCDIAIFCSFFRKKGVSKLQVWCWFVNSWNGINWITLSLPNESCEFIYIYICIYCKISWHSNVLNDILMLSENLARTPQTVDRHFKPGTPSGSQTKRHTIGFANFFTRPFSWGGETRDLAFASFGTVRTLFFVPFDLIKLGNKYCWKKSPSQDCRLSLLQNGSLFSREKTNT